MNLREITFLWVVAILCNLAKAASIRRRGEYGFFFFGEHVWRVSDFESTYA